MSDRDPHRRHRGSRIRTGGSAQKVWRALTEPKLVAEWLKPDDGATIESLGSSKRSPAVFCAIAGETWAMGRRQQTMDSVVTFELARTPDGGTHLRIDPHGFREAICADAGTGMASMAA